MGNIGFKPGEKPEKYDSEWVRKQVVDIEADPYPHHRGKWIEIRGQMGQTYGVYLGLRRNKTLDLVLMPSASIRTVPHPEKKDETMSYLDYFEDRPIHVDYDGPVKIIPSDENYVKFVCAESKRRVFGEGLILPD